jgi:hypothetical protein
VSRPLRILSLGAGVQSSTIALMSARGDLPALDYAIFADTGWEPARVYSWLDWLETQLPFPLIRARRPGPDLGQRAIEIATQPVTRTASPPWYTRDLSGKLQMLPLQCSKEYKTRVVYAAVRQILGIAPRQRGPSEPVVDVWIGISTDEAHRMKPAEPRYIRNVWPLIDAGISRRDCLRWMEVRQMPQPPKSSCIFCPLRDNEAWRRMRADQPDDWAKAVAFDRAIRPGFHGMTGAAFVHRSGVPLDQVDLSTWAERGQGDLFGAECEGVCGV